jgi:hypothetical protein
MPLSRVLAVLFGFCVLVCFLGWVYFKKFMPRPEPPPVVIEYNLPPTKAPPKVKLPQPGELITEFKRTHASKVTAHGVILEETIAETSDLRFIEYCTSEDKWFRVAWELDGREIVFGQPREIPAPTNPTAWHRSVVDPIKQWKELADKEIARLDVEVAQAGLKVKEAEEQIELARRGIVILNAPEEIRKTAKGALWVFPSEPARQRRILEIKTKVLPQLVQTLQGWEIALRRLRSQGIIVPRLPVTEMAISKAGWLVGEKGEPLEVYVGQVLDGRTASLQLEKLTVVLEGDSSSLVDGAKITLPPVQVVGTRLHQNRVVFRLVRVTIPKVEPVN